VTFDDPPPSAAWRHEGAREGFETVFIRPTRRGWRFRGHTTAVEDGQPWAVRYDIGLDRSWRTRTARVWTSTVQGVHHRSLHCDPSGRWDVDGRYDPDLDGCLDVDLEASACTNTFPVHREVSDAPAAYVRIAGDVERLEQTYTQSEGGFDYAAPRFDFACRLEYDRSGLVVRYPGIATRAY
jgi:hypothetical protein